MFCTNCGAKIKPGTRFCPQCGADLSAMADADETVAGEALGDAQDLTQPMPPAHASWEPRQASSEYSGQDEPSSQDEWQATSPQAMAGGAVAPREVPQAPAHPKAGSLRPDPERGGRKVALIALGVLALCAAAVAGVILGVMPMINANHKEPSIVRTDDSSSSNGTKKITLGGSDEDDADSSSSEEHVGFKGVTRASASSTLPTDQYADYGAQNLIDGNVTTCWAEGASGLGIRESVTLSGDERQTFSAVSIANGYQKSESLYYKNPRATRLGVSVDGKKVMDVDLPDNEFGSITRFELPEPVDGNSITFTIEAATPGSKYEDTSISEITVS
ncbi:NADase-type glycan-binding domain-containing protein [Parafannyhessea umbonata]|jgi:hypothetical protein|uniref:Zinc-ribbon domain-containing protein n=2 Tax=Parafannyhessea umbonata TaxID=604330 RepID=A0A6N7XBD8_9ACTN|nr:zinc-ribbon domain-containing protein [Parafannyhessea umbonata]MST60599.1 zinc-ribbon domain-containing protein [Parafannyhessea umbonata]